MDPTTTPDSAPAAAPATPPHAPSAPQPTQTPQTFPAQALVDLWEPPLPRALAWLGPLVLVLFFTLLLGPMFRPGPLISDAHPSRLAEVYSEFQRAFGQQHWFAGWDRRLQGGFPVGTHQYQTSYLLICALGAVGIPLDVGYKLAFFGAMVLAAWLLARLVRPSCGSGLAFGMAIAFFLTPSALRQVAQGFWNHLLALGLLAWFTGWLARCERLDRQTAPPLMALYALIALTHEYTAIATGLVMLGFLPGLWLRGGWRTLAWWCALPLAAVLLVAPYTLPLALTHEYLVKMESGRNTLPVMLGAALPLVGLNALNPFDTGESRVSTLASEWPVFLSVLLVAVLLLRWRKLELGKLERRLAAGLLLALVPFALIVLRMPQWFPLEAVRAKAAQIVPERFMQYAHWILLTLGTITLRALLREAATWRRGAARLAARALPWALAAAVLVMTAGAALSLNRNQRLATLGTLPERRDIHAVWSWLRAHDTGNDRVLYETPYGNFPWRDGTGRALNQSTVMALGPIESGVPGAGELLNIVLPMHERTRTSNGRIMNEKVETAQADVVNPLLVQGNFGWIVACSPRMRGWLESNPRMRREATFGEFSIHRFLDAPGAWATMRSGQPVQLLRDPANDGHLQAMLETTTVADRLTLRMTWHPFWSATANGRPLGVAPDAYGNLTVALPNPGAYSVQLHYRARFGWQIALALGAWAAWGALMLTRRRTGPAAA